MSGLPESDALQRCDLVGHAEGLCRRRGARLTAHRRRILSNLGRSERPLGAYEILDVFRDPAASSAPPTVYRALDFPMDKA